jgi:hypothetical protein
MTSLSEGIKVNNDCKHNLFKLNSFGVEDIIFNVFYSYLTPSEFGALCFMFLFEFNSFGVFKIFYPQIRHSEYNLVTSSTHFNTSSNKFCPPQYKFVYL